ncbi:hypothetical protein NDU88_002811 [Pleurodeles waltl]|uniref:Uncharacterized protein n=1 Tax=Pleurodeles waltl TaxID=8319 RepID=A0AAV7SFU6_PLEWA|nr:hypothetical protein NDU88_002811 [Pleurodeles waltl]
MRTTDGVLAFPFRLSGSGSVTNPFSSQLLRSDVLLTLGRGSACVYRSYTVRRSALLRQLRPAANPSCLSGPRLLRYREVVEEAV